MRKLGLLVVVGALAGATAVAHAQVQLNIFVEEKTVDGSPGSSTINVDPGDTVQYQVRGELTPGTGHMGLALAGFNLVYSGGALEQADTPTTPPDGTCATAMGNFVKNWGITNPAGYGGTIINGDLVQVCGAQNTIKNVDSADFPIGEVLTGVAQPVANGGCGPAVLATGQLTIPVTAGAGQSYTLTATELFANVIAPGQNGTEEFWATLAATAGTNTPLTMTIQATVLPALTASYPAADTNLWRTTDHVVRLKFDLDLGSAPVAGEVTIRKLLAGGAFDSDVSSNFSFTVENDEFGNPRVLKIEDTGNNLDDRAWYEVANNGAWAGAATFSVDFRQAAGNANDDNFVNALDLSFVNNRVQPLPSGNTFDWVDTSIQQKYRANVNADNFVNALDLSAVNNRVAPLPLPGKPSGH